jgi:lysozyme family protein
MTADAILDELLDREGGWRDAKQRPDGSWDPATNKGITLPTLQAYWKAHVDATRTLTVADLRQLTDDLARTIYQRMYVEAPGFTPANIPYEPLRVQLIDFGVNSGPATAIRWLQRVLGMRPDQVDGIFGTLTRMALAHMTHDVSPVRGQLRWRLLNDALVAARSYMIDRLEDTGKLRPADEEGVESRALSFFLAKP